ncbi:MAG: hypothetical protein K2X35_07060 [Bryobacteraceae bacterium]|nr:hypothetical protein [Bryobacteraceae bacterium]
MPQVTIYLDAETERKARKAAAGLRIPLSRWVAKAVQEKTAQVWPPEVLALAGAWPDFPDLAELRASDAADLPREPLD